MSNSVDVAVDELPVSVAIHAQTVQSQENSISHLVRLLASTIEHFAPPKLLIEIKSSLKQQEPATAAARIIDVFSWLLRTMAMAFLTFNSGLAVYRARDDPWTVAFVCSAYTNLLLLLWILRAFERTPPEQTQSRNRLKVAIWVLATTLNLTFSYHVSQMLPFWLAAAIWCFAAFVTATTFWVFFIYSEGRNNHGSPFDAKHTAMRPVTVLTAHNTVG